MSGSGSYSDIDRVQRTWFASGISNNELQRSILSNEFSDGNNIKNGWLDTVSKDRRKEKKTGSVHIPKSVLPIWGSFRQQTPIHIPIIHCCVFRLYLPANRIKRLLSIVSVRRGRKSGRREEDI